MRQTVLIDTGGKYFMYVRGMPYLATSDPSTNEHMVQFKFNDNDVADYDRVVAELMKINEDDPLDRRVGYTLGVGLTAILVYVFVQWLVSRMV